MEQLRFSRYSGEAISAIVRELAQLRITVFHEFPYLYEGSMDYEIRYLDGYTQSPGSFVLLVHDGDKAIGATTCMPLLNETSAIREPFEHAGIAPETVMYFGESIVLPEYRGRGLGHRFFDERERFALQSGCTLTAFCAVDRAEDHPLRPADHRSNDAFWAKRGYERRPELTCTMAWPDRGETAETEKTLTFYTKAWK